MATSTLSPRSLHGNGNGSAYLTIGQACSAYNLSPATLRRATDSGKLPCFKTPSGHRRFKASQLEEVLGLVPEGEAEKENDGGKVKVCCLARVSGAQQGQGFSTAEGKRKDGAEESDLERQVETLRKVAKERYGVEGTLYSDIGSGLNYNRKNFTTLLEEVCQGKWSGGVVLATFKDRVCRYGFELVELICRTHNVRLELVNSQDEVSDEAELADDVLSIITYYSAKKHGLRSALNNTFTIKPEAVALAKTLHDSGYPLLHIVKCLRSEGHTMVNGRGEVKPVTLHLVRKLFDNGQGKMLEMALPKEEGNTGTSWDDFSRDHIDLTGNLEDKVTAKDIYKAYLSYCEANDCIPLTITVVGKWLKAHCRKYLSKGVVKYSGVKMGVLRTLGQGKS